MFKITPQVCVQMPLVGQDTDILEYLIARDSGSKRIYSYFRIVNGKYQGVTEEIMHIYHFIKFSTFVKNYNYGCDKMKVLAMPISKQWLNGLVCSNPTERQLLAVAKKYQFKTDNISDLYAYLPEAYIVLNQWLHEIYTVEPYDTGSTKLVPFRRIAKQLGV